MPFTGQAVLPWHGWRARRGKSVKTRTVLSTSPGVRWTALLTSPDSIQGAASLLQPVWTRWGQGRAAHANAPPHQHDGGSTCTVSG